MIVACHQPNFLPWLGFFAKAFQSDVFVLLDDVNPPLGKDRHNYINRTRIADFNGQFWLTIPVAKHGPLDQIGDLRIDTTRFGSWRDKTLKTVASTYARSPYREGSLDLLSARLGAGHEQLAHLNAELISDVFCILGIRTQVVKSSDLSISTSGNERLRDIVHSLNGTTYLSGMGAASYMNESVFLNAGMRVAYSEFSLPKYRQHNTRSFEPGLSVLDAMCNLSPATIETILDGNWTDNV